MGELSKEDKKRIKKQVKKGEYNGFARQFHANTESENIGEPGLVKIIVDCLVGPIFYLIVASALVYFIYSSSESPMVIFNEFHTYGCQTMMDDLKSNPLTAKNKYVNTGIKVIGCEVGDIGQNGIVDIKPIEGMLHTSVIKLKFKEKDSKIVEHISVGDKCVVWGIVREVTESPFPDYVMEVIEMRVTRQAKK